MQLTHQASILATTQIPYPQAAGTAAPTTQHNQVQGPGSSSVVPGSIDSNGRSTEYPEASPAERHARHTRHLKWLKSPKQPVTPPVKPPKPPKPPVKPPKPSKKPIKQKGTKRTLEDSQRLVELNKNNAFPPLSKQLAISARNTFVSGAVGSLVNIPFSVGQYFASQALIDRIEAQAKMPGAEQVTADGTKKTVDPKATQQQKLEARLENSEIKLELMVNTILSINEGPDAKAVSKGPGAPTDTGGRLTNLEKSMGAVESQMQDIAKRYGLIYEPYTAPESSEAPTDDSRMETVEQRLVYMNRMLKRLLKNAEADAEGDE